MWMATITIQHLRTIALIEGVSYLLLLFIGMPLKYGWDILMPNKIMGMIHGILTIIFCAILFYLWNKKKVHSGLAIVVFVASLIPFGAFIVDRKLKELSIIK